MPLVCRTWVRDDTTPVRAYASLRALAKGPTFLLESAVAGERWGRYSILGCLPRETIELGVGPDALARIAPPALELAPSIAARFATAHVGIVPYDAVHSLHPVPSFDDGLLRGALLGGCAVLVFDHLAHVVHAAAHDEAALELLDAALARGGPLSRLGPPDPTRVPADLDVSVDDATYETWVRRAQEYIAAGDAFQIVPARTFSVPAVDRDPLDVYRAMRLLSPAPYMYLFELEGLALAGASPETLVRKERGVITLRPIAGTRRRGATPDEDAALAAELLADPKERAEHVMLIDLARNDVGRVAETGSVALPRRLEIERFSHVMHIVSEVEGRARPGATAAEVVAAAFPAGTLTGAPKVRAMQIIRELEGRPRGVYGGAVGYVTAAGDLDLAIAIRSVVFRGGRAEVTAGAGVVEASVPRLEAEETRAKARAALAALA